MVANQPSTIGLVLSMIIALQSGACPKTPDSSATGTKPSPSPSASPSASIARKVTVSKPSGTEVSPGVWGGEHITLTMTAKGATIEFDCAAGTIDEAIVLSDQGRFDVAGTFAPEGGPVSVPVNGNRQEKKAAARYRGSVDGERMTLAITMAEDGRSVGDFSLTRGRAGHLEKCY